RKEIVMALKPSALAYLFPGQGAQYVEMGLDIAQNSPAAAEAYRRAAAALDIPLLEICFEGPEEVLRETANAQPSIVATSVALHDAFREAGGPESTCMAGHSLGEYSALIASGAFDLETGIRLVRRRGELMSQAASVAGGVMSAVVGLDHETLEKLTSE